MKTTSKNLKQIKFFSNFTLFLSAVILLLSSCSKEDTLVGDKSKVFLTFKNLGELSKAYEDVKRSKFVFPSKFISLDDYYRQIMQNDDLLRTELDKGEEGVFMVIDESIRGIVETSTPFAKLINSKGQIGIGDSVYQINQKVTIVTHIDDFGKNDFTKSNVYTIERTTINGQRGDLKQCTGLVNGDSRRKITGLIFDTNYIWSRHQGIKTKIEKKTGVFGAWVS